MIVSTCKRLPYLLWGGMAIHCDHRNLAYISGANGAPTSKAVAQRLQGYRVFIGQFAYTIVHIPGDENCWGDLLSRLGDEKHGVQLACGYEHEQPLDEDVRRPLLKNKLGLNFTSKTRHRSVRKTSARIDTRESQPDWSPWSFHRQVERIRSRLNITFLAERSHHTLEPNKRMR